MKKQIKVTICDDSRECGMTWASALKKEGIYAVTRKKDSVSLIKEVETDPPDFLVISYEMKDIIRELRSTGGRLPLVIVFSDNCSAEAELSAKAAGADSFITTPLNPDQLVRRIKLLSDFQNGIAANSAREVENIEYIVTDIIRKIGVPASIKGYHYLRAAIILTVTDEENLQSITKQLYPAVARHYHTTSTSVERAIRHAVGTAWEHGNSDDLTETLGYYPVKKPSNSELIAVISDRLRLKYFPGTRII